MREFVSHWGVRIHMNKHMLEQDLANWLLVSPHVAHAKVASPSPSRNDSPSPNPGLSPNPGPIPSPTLTQTLALALAWP